MQNSEYCDNNNFENNLSKPRIYTNIKGVVTLSLFCLVFLRTWIVDCAHHNKSVTQR